MGAYLQKCELPQSEKEMIKYLIFLIIKLINNGLLKIYLSFLG